MFDAHLPRRLTLLCGGVLLLVLAAAGCSDAVPTALDAPEPSVDEPTPPEAGTFSKSGAGGQLLPDVRTQLVHLRRATARYHDVGNAAADGWTVRFPPECLTHVREGGMGHHLLNPDLIGDDTADEVEVTRPEFLVYEPGPAGQMRLVGVEYVVPFAARPADATPPTLFGRDFHPNETFRVWALHVWAWRHNPSGIFADWNPKVTCRHAEDVRTFPED